MMYITPKERIPPLFISLNVSACSSALPAKCQSRLYSCSIFNRTFSLIVLIISYKYNSIINVGTNLLNQGVYDTETADPAGRKANLAEFQCIEKTSAEVATPTSPIPPALESGVMVRKGTAEVIVFKLLR